jgi:hypothetical protein
MSSKNPFVKVHLTPQQKEALEEAARTTGTGLSEFVRDAIAKSVRDTGIPFPEDLLKRGTYKRKSKQR